MKSNVSVVTTSWDDGHPRDLKIAELLSARGLPGTFYYAFRSPEGRRILTPTQLRSLAAKGFELGGHTVSHTILTRLPFEDMIQEVRECKMRMEDVLGEAIHMFCYPKGRFNAEAIEQVRAAGFQGARTTRMFWNELGFDPYQMPTSLHAFPNTRMQYARNLIRGSTTKRLLLYLSKFARRNSWVSMAKALFDQVLNEGGVWHLYGHSWLIEEANLWGDLVNVLDYVSGRAGVRYVNNGDLVRTLETAATYDLSLAS